MAKKKMVRMYTVTVETTKDYLVSASSKDEAIKLAKLGKGLQITIGVCNASARVVHEGSR